MSSKQTAPVGIFDSGVGGLTIATAVQRRLPHEDLIYLADQAHVPYGSKPLAEVRQLATWVVRFLLEERAKLIVVACNTASAAALQHLRELYPSTPFVGMEPAVKPAAIQTHTRQVGVLATEATFQGELYSDLLARFAQDVTVHQHACPGLVNEIEAGNLESAKTQKILESAIVPMLQAGVDNIVLGCTHYPLVMPLIRCIAGPGVAVIDPAPAVARQVGRVLHRRSLTNPSSVAGQLRVRTTGDPAALEGRIPIFLEALASDETTLKRSWPLQMQVHGAVLSGESIGSWGQ